MVWSFVPIVARLTMRRPEGGAVMSDCVCGNVATVDGLCEWCAFHAECVAPATVTPYRGRLTGEALWACDGCGGVWAAVDCVCELDHECVSVWA